MATHDYVIANASGAAVRADLNNALAAIVSNNSNATEPATTYAYQWWADTTAGQLKLRNAANDSWVVIGELDGTKLIEDGTAGAPGLAFADDLDTGLFRAAANQLGIACNGSSMATFGENSAAFTVSVSDDIGDVRDVPQNSQTASYTLTATDAGKHISITTGGVTVPAGVLAVGNVVTIYNNSSSNQTITQGSSVTLRLVGTSTTGNRTLAQYGLCSVLCVASNVFVISGVGLS